jgi:hypothetical protein
METCSSGSRGRRSSLVVGGSKDLQQKVSDLLTLDTDESRDKWSLLFGFNPSPLLSRLFMIRSIAHRLQEKVFGGLKPFVQRLLDEVYDAGPQADLTHLPKKRASAGLS